MGEQTLDEVTSPERLKDPSLVKGADAAADPHFMAFFQWYSIAVAAVGVAVGVAALLGWALDVAALKSVLPGLTPMMPNTAVGFVLIGVGLGVASSTDPPLRRRRAAAAAAGLVAALGLLTLVEYVVGADLHFDLLLFRHSALAVQTSPPGRMAPTTAACFLVLGSALICAGARRYQAAALLSSLAALIGLNGVLGYLYGVASQYHTSAFPTMALNTAVTLFVTALGVLVLAPERLLVAHRSASGVLMRRLLPISILGVVGVGWLRLAGQQAGFYGSEFGVSLMVVASVSILTGLIVWTSGSLHRVDCQRMAADRALRTLNAELENRVRQRTLELRSSEERFRSLAESAPVGTFRTDARGRCSYVNPAWSELTGLSHEEAIDKGWVRMVHPEDQDRVLSSWGQAVAAGDADAQRFRVRTPGGAVRWVDARAVALRDDGGAVEGFIRTICDISTQVEAEEAIAGSRNQLEQANVQLARSNEELEQFAYIASHDLSEPLRAISGPISLLGRRYRGQLDPEADQFIEFAVDGCRRMQAMIDDLLAFSRAGRINGELQLVDSNLVMKTVIAELGPRIDETGATVRVDPLPTVASQPTQLGQVFQNLISNALKFVPAGVAPEVVVCAERTAGEWRFLVTDNGIGIEPHHRERIFGMFKRLHGRSDYAGSGIGLALCKRIIEREGGSIGVEEAPSGQGARFWFALPIASPMASSLASRKAS
jgi:PAS domain S-box-containing protein